MFDFIEGSNSSDTLVGDGRDTYILALGGDDILTGAGGDDTLNGGSGTDTVSEQGNVDFTLSDTQLIGLGTDQLISIEEAKLVGGSSGNRLDASQFSGDVELYGLGGNDTLIGGTGYDLLVGGTGNDTYVVNHFSDHVDEKENEGHDTVNSSVSYTLRDHVEDLTLTGNQAVVGVGNNLRNYIRGNSANNALEGGIQDFSVDTLAGGDGDDYYHVDLSIHPDSPSPFVFIDQVIESENQGIDTVELENHAGPDLHALSYQLSDNVENLHLDEAITSTFYAYGNQLDNEIRGNSSENNLFGYAGVDILSGNEGNDILDGGEGDDILDGGIDQDIADYSSSTGGISVDLSKGSGTDGMGGTDTLLSIEQISGSDFDDVIKGDAQDNILDGNSGRDHLYGLEGNDVLRGGSEADVLDGGTGVDQLLGGDGGDLYFIDNVADRVIEYEDEGYDTVRTSRDHYVLEQHIERLQLIGDAATGYGNDEDNTIYGRVGQIKSDNLFGGDGNDVIHGWEGDDNLDGDAGHDRLLGTNVFKVNPGENEIDVLTGGSGQDLFGLGHVANDQAFYAYSGDNDYALITDFSDGDLIQIKGVFEDYDLRIGTGVGPVDTGDIGIYFTQAGANDLIAVVENVDTLNQSDFQELV